jgi:carboxynorspermidine decarboxylase
VLDIVHNELDIALLDTSASAHMPDVLEMPYRPRIEGADEPGKLAHTYRLAGPTCLAGDVIGDYSFDRPLKVGDKLVFYDMAHYTMVKNTMFNGINLPDIVLYDPKAGEFKLQRRFTYEDFKSRLS